MRMIVLVAAAAIAAAAAAQGQDGVRLTVTVTGAEADEGQILAGLFQGEADYSAAMNSRGATSPHREGDAAVGADGSATLVFDGLAPGEYALSAHYDRDGDGVMNTGLFGIPSEKIGFSNNARLRFGPPSWEDARFDVGAAGAEITIALKQPE